jgi:bloom syndrome protein
VTEEGVTFVIMPLISLIEDNFSYVRSLDIPAVNLTGFTRSAKNDAKLAQDLQLIRQLEIRIVYLTPEKIMQSPEVLQLMEELYSKGKIDRFAIDEVHCVSHWG